jgi:hypothetical protein
MIVGAPSPHLGGDPNCFHELLWGCTVPQCRLGMPLDAVRALGDVRDCDSDDVLDLRGQDPIGEDSLAEGIECCFDVGSEDSSCCERSREARIFS